jgi:hypothetical protein
LYKKLLCNNKRERVLMRTVLVVLFIGVSGSIAQAISLDDLAPCKPAAARYCDRSGGMTWSNLVRCGATLAAHSFHVGNGCRDVLRRYGQL